MLRQSSITDMKKADVDESEVKVTFRQYIERFLTSYYGKRIIQVSLFLSFFSCIIYVVMTYMRVNLTGADQLYPPKLAWFLYVDIAILVYYLLEYILVFESITNVFTIVPLFFTTVTGTNFIMFLQICRIFRFLRLALFVFTFNKFGATEVSRQMIKILLTLLTLILFTATALEAIENTVREGSGKTTIHEMIYFVVVTLATVGYGDVVPESELGRVCVMTLILFTIVLIPMQTNDLIRLMGLQSYYARTLYKSNSEVPHLLVTGYVNVSALRDFSVELFHPDHGSQDKNAVILQPKDPSVEMISFLHHPQYELFLTYLRGNQMAQKDLKRGAAVQAKACVILTKKYASDSHIIDHKNILTGLAIKKYVQHCTNGKDIRLIMQLIKPESKTHFYSSLNRKSNDQLIIIEEIKMNLLAKSCFSPGIISMLSNLITSAGDATGTMNDEDKKEWMAEYTAGRGYEIYRTDLSHKFQGKKFSEVAAIVYNEFQGILFGLELDVSGQTIIRLNPGNYSIPHTMENKIHVYMICEDKKVADQVALYEMTTEEIAAYQQQKNHHKKNQKKAEKMESEDQADGESEFTSNNPNDIQQDDTELLESDYTLLPDPVNLMQVTRISIQDHSDITNHIVVCGVHPSIYYFLLPLRASYLNELQYVVILAPEPPNNEVWEGLNRFPKIIYVKGSPLSEEDLQRANINFADKAVILSRDISGAKLQLDTDDKLDAEAVFIYKAIKRCNKNVQIMIELMHSSNSEFLLPQKIKRDNQNSNFEFRHELTPLFAAGEIYISSIIDTLTSQAFYNPHIVTILQQILSGGKQSNNVIRTICELAELKQSNLWQISIPEDYLNKTFGELFNYLTVERELLPMGLYRLPGATDNHHPYVYTNPDPLTKLTHRDKVFVLAANMPNDLMSGFTQTQTPGGPGEYGGAASTNANIKIASHTNLSYEREDGRTKGQDLNRSRDMDLKRKELTRFKLEVPQTQNRYADGQQKGNKSNQLDLENLNQNSVTHFMFEQINNELSSMQQEIQKIKQKVTLQNDQILEKVRSALRQEFSTLGH